jgi:hypothetical protein
MRSSTTSFEALITRVKKEFTPILDDRSNNRAHPYESGSRADVKMLNADEVRALLTYSEQLVNDLRHVALMPIYGFGDYNDTDCKAAARDVVDAVLLGTSEDIAETRGARDRDDFYEALHAEHDKRTMPEDAPAFFNSYSNRLAVLGPT